MKMQSINFYQSHLDRVSRSFAFCIQKLEDPLRRHVSLAYLLCRVLDTVEDSAWASAELQSEQYTIFEDFLKSLPTEAAIQKWVRFFPDSIPETEKQLLQDAFLLFHDLHSLPEPIQSDMRDTVLRMGDGMKHYSATQVGNEGIRNALKLSNLKEVNQYCYFVAGIVGELLSRLFLAYCPNFKPGSEFLKDSFHFGLFLQKINLLKDQRGDEKEGRYLVPNRAVLLNSLIHDAKGSLRYLTSLPVEEAGYRTFCAWSLFLGFASLPFIEKNYAEESGTKISREMTQALMQEIESIATDNQALLQSGEECLASIPKLTDSATSPENNGLRDDAWFFSISGQVLSKTELIELGILTPVLS